MFQANEQPEDTGGAVDDALGGLENAAETGMNVLNNLITDLFPNQTVWSGWLFDLTSKIVLLIGVVFVYLGIRRVILELNQSPMTGGSVNIAVPATFVLSGFCLIAIDQVFMATSGSLTNTYHVLAYADSSLASSSMADKAKANLRSILMMLQFIGFVFFVRGVALAPAVAEGKDPNARASKVAFRVIVGYLLADIYFTLNIIEYYLN